MKAKSSFKMLQSADISDEQRFFYQHGSLPGVYDLFICADRLIRNAPTMQPQFKQRYLDTAEKICALMDELVALGPIKTSK